MMNTMYRFVERNAQGRLVLVGLLMIVIINVIIFPNFSEFVFGVSVPVEIILDVNPFYTPQIANDLMNTLGDVGRKSYFSSTLFVDMPYAIIYTFTYMITLFYLFQKNGWKPRWWVLAFPLLIGFLDLFENSGILFLTSNYPNHYDSLVTVMSKITLFKWVFALLTFLTLLVSFVRFLGLKLSRN